MLPSATDSMELALHLGHPRTPDLPVLAPRCIPCTSMATATGRWLPATATSLLRMGAWILRRWGSIVGRGLARQQCEEASIAARGLIEARRGQELVLE